MADQDMDKSQPATPYKLQKAREQGQVAKSRDVISAVTFTAAMAFLASQGWDAWRRVFQMDRLILAQVGNVEATQPAMWHLIEQVVRATLELGAPFLATVLLAAIVGNLLQTGPILSFETIKPTWARINPAQGFKRLFSVRTLFDGARAILKLVLLGLVAYFSLKNLAPSSITSPTFLLLALCARCWTIAPRSA